MTGKKKFAVKNPQDIFGPLALLAVLLLLWESAVDLFHVPVTVLPPPSGIFREMSANFSRDILPQMIFDLQIIFGGYAIAVPVGFLIAAVCSQFHIVSRMISPVNVFLLVTPMSALVPILMLGLGFNPAVRLIVVVLQTTPIIMLNTLTGFSKVEQSKIELMRSLGATRMQTFRKVVFPNALPQVFTGLKLGCIFSTIAAMGADLAIGKMGLGYRIQEYSSLIMMEMVFGTIIVVALIGIIMFQIVVSIEKRVIVWNR